jgi:ATP-dependent protease HslVU (ClpYQ) peptidase subunit
MTTIVWDGKTLAADGRMTAGNRVCEEDRQKIFVDTVSTLRGATVICYALAGAADMVNRVGVWISEGCPHTVEDHPYDWGEAGFEVIIVTTESVFVYHSESNDLLEIFHKVCLGSGGEFAQTALHMGKDAKACVKIAAEIDLFSGGLGTFINCRTKKMALKDFVV